MQQNHTVETLDSSGDAYDPTFRGYATLWFALDLCFLCLVEARVIRGLWLAHWASFDAFERCSVPIFVLFPGLMALAALVAVRRLSGKGKIEPSATGKIEHIIGALVFAAYLALQELTTIAFR
jgi:hypothetical protein